MKKQPTFEEAMAQLEEIVKKLETGEETLDESLKLFEEGARLSSILEKKLNTAEQKIAKLTDTSANKEIPQKIVDSAENKVG